MFLLQSQAETYLLQHPPRPSSLDLGVGRLARVEWELVLLCPPSFLGVLESWLVLGEPRMGDMEQCAGYLGSDSPAEGSPVDGLACSLFQAGSLQFRPWGAELKGPYMAHMREAVRSKAPLLWRRGLKEGMCTPASCRPCSWKELGYSAGGW